ncbi:DUF2147 domain-containing protein [Sphingobium sp. 15-1]|uniref:DUF2147 domain-containing protein n=1 Tax=Sphingobium sp. 15-1 TaxID=2729616 RepID=UPI00159CAC38|nr:DUF2147 domain-containing protein [Sphingobium sp. 15-1]
MGLIPISLLLLAGAAASPDIAGLWLTDDHKGVVRIEPCGPYLCGRVARILDRDPAVPRTDVNNPDSRLRNRPILGLTTLWGFRVLHREKPLRLQSDTGFSHRLGQ